jgi:EmrB/QacA subfamily drug resistance transporter
MVTYASARGRWVLLATILGSGLAAIDGTVVGIALPAIGHEFRTGMTSLQWMVTGYTLTLAGFLLIGGALGDRYGRRKVFVIGVVWFAGASVLCGLAPNIGTLVAARTFQGCGAALCTPGSLALLQSSFGEEDRAKAIGTWSGFSGVSTAIGPFLGGWLIDAFSWRWIFFLNVPLAVLAIVATVLWVPESRQGTGQHRFDATGAVLAALGLASITYALTEHGMTAWIAALVGVAGFAAFFIVEHRLGWAAMLPLRLFASRDFAAINAVTFVIYAALSGMAFFLITQLQVVGGFSALEAGVALLPLTILSLLFSRRAGAVGARVGPHWPLTVGSVVAGCGILLLLRVGPDTSYWLDVLPGGVAFGAGMTILVAPLTAAVLAAAPDDMAGVASGVSNAVSRAGGLLAVAALPLVVGLSGEDYANPVRLNHAFHRVMWICAGLYGVGALMSATLVGRRQCPSPLPCPPPTPNNPTPVPHRRAARVS